MNRIYNSIMPLFTLYDVYGVILPMCTGDGSTWQMFLLVVGMTVSDGYQTVRFFVGAM